MRSTIASQPRTTCSGATLLGSLDVGRFESFHALQDLLRPGRHQADVGQRLEQRESLILILRDLFGSLRRAPEKLAMLLACFHDPLDRIVQLRVILIAAQSE